MKNKLKFPNLYKVVFTGSRKPALIVAENYAQAARIGYILCSKDETSVDISAIIYEDCCVTYNG